VAERGIKWRSPGEVWRTYAATHCTGEYRCPEPVHVDGCLSGSVSVIRRYLSPAEVAEEAARFEHARATGGRDLI
jgi:hypothetical protein